MFGGVHWAVLGVSAYPFLFFSFCVHRAAGSSKNWRSGLSSVVYCGILHKWCLMMEPLSSFVGFWDCLYCTFYVYKNLFDLITFFFMKR